MYSTIKVNKSSSSITDVTAAVASHLLSTETIWDSAVEGDTEEEQEAQTKRSRGRPEPNGSKSRKTAIEQPTDTLTIADPNQIAITDLDARHRQSARRGRPVFAPAFWSASDRKGMDERRDASICFNGGIAY